MQSPLQLWRRRWWRRDPQAIAAYAGLKPMVVVTGGSEGIGYALARRFAAASNGVMLVARRPGPLREAADRIGADYKVEAVPVSADVTAPDAIAIIEAALAAHGAYADVLVNSAGIGLSGPFLDQREEDVLQLLDTNMRGLTRLTRHFLSGMRVRGRGGILNLGSLGGYGPGPYQAVYYASKAYVHSFSEAIAAETAGEGVRITVLAPGPVNTAFHAKMGAEHALYRYIVAPASPEAVARAGYIAFALGLRVAVPGLLNPLFALALRILPHRIVIPIVGVLLRPMGRAPDDAGR
jgi:short-subunit dehydrogenase